MYELPPLKICFVASFASRLTDSIFANARFFFSLSLNFIFLAFFVFTLLHVWVSVRCVFLLFCFVLFLCFMCSPPARVRSMGCINYDMRLKICILNVFHFTSKMCVNNILHEPNSRCSNSLSHIYFFILAKCFPRLVENKSI